MGKERVSRDDLPSDGVAIGGDERCEHATYRRIGSDGGSNIYFNCTDCSKVVLKYSAVEETGRSSPGSDTGPSAHERDTSADSIFSSRHDPLVQGLSLGPDDSKDGHSNRDGRRQRTDGAGFFERVRERLDRLFRSEK